MKSGVFNFFRTTRSLLGKEKLSMDILLRDSFPALGYLIKAKRSVGKADSKLFHEV